MAEEARDIARDLGPLHRALDGIGLHAGLPVTLPIIVAIGALVAWELLVRAFHIPQVLLPSPSQVLVVFASERSALLWAHAWPTGAEAIFGFLLAASVGILLAAAMAYSDAFKATIYPYLVGLQVVPKIALAPIFVLWFGIGFTSRIGFAAFMCVFPIVIAAATGLRDTHPDVIRMCRAIGATRWQMLWQVRLPFAVPYLFAGLRIAATMAIIGVVIAEFITADRGLGYLILYAASRSDTPLVIAAILLLCVIGLLLYGAVARLERAVYRRQGI